MSCPACEQNRLAGRRFCTQCGARLIDSEPPAEPEIPAQPEDPKQQMPEAAAPVPPVEAEKPKKKVNKPAIALFAVLVALLAAAAVLFATGVISFGSGKADREDAEVSDKEASDDEDKDDAGDAEPEDDGAIEIYADESSTVKLRGVEEDDEEYRFLISMENKTDELAIFNVYIAGVNGYALPDMNYSVYDEVEGGDTRNTRITLPKSEYEVYQLGDIEVMTFAVRVSNDDLVEATGERATIRLDGKDASGYERPERRTFTNEQTLIDQDGVLVTVGSPFKSEYWEDLCIMVYFENTVDDDLMISIGNVKANGLALEDSGAYLTLPADSTGYTVLQIDSFYLEKLELTVDEVTELTADLEAEFWTEWEPFFTGTVTYPVALEE